MQSQWKGPNYAANLSTASTYQQHLVPANQAEWWDSSEVTSVPNKSQLLWTNPLRSGLITTCTAVTFARCAAENQPVGRDTFMQFGKSLNSILDHDLIKASSWFASDRLEIVFSTKETISTQAKHVIWGRTYGDCSKKNLILSEFVAVGFMAMITFTYFHTDSMGI